MGNLMIWAVVGIVVILIGITLIILIRMLAGDNEEKALDKGWGALAEETRLQYTPPDKNLETAILQGSYRGRPVTVRVRGHTFLSKNKRTTVFFTHVAIVVRNVYKIYVRMYRKGAVGKTDRALAAPNITLGDETLDRLFSVKSYPEAFMPLAIESNRQLRQRLVELGSVSNPELEIEGGDLRYQQQGIESKPEVLKSLLESLCDFAEAVERGGK